MGIQNKRRHRRCVASSGLSARAKADSKKIPSGNHTLLESWFHEHVDERISMVQLVGPCDKSGNFVSSSGSQVQNSMLILTTPPFKPFGEILFRLALRFPSGRVLEVSNQPEVQVKISVKDAQSSQGGDGSPSAEALLQRWFGDIQSDTSFCTEGSKQSSNATRNVSISVDYSMLGKRCLGLDVKCPVLLAVLRRIAHLHSVLKLEQIYDFWT